MYPTRHETKTTKMKANTKITLTAEFDSDKTEWFITRGDQSKVSTAEQIRWQSSKLRLRDFNGMMRGKDMFDKIES